MLYGMIAWYVPYETFPNTYNGQPLGLASLASQKQYISLHTRGSSRVTRNRPGPRDP
jgi:hypothetical protein